MPTKYTLTQTAPTGSVKVLATAIPHHFSTTTVPVTRTVATVRNLVDETLADLVEALNDLDGDLTAGTERPEEFAQALKKLGVRTHEVLSEQDGNWALTLSGLADRVVRGPVPTGPGTHLIGSLSTCLHIASLLPAPAARALRSELRDTLARYDGIVITAVVYDIDGPIGVNAARFIADAPVRVLADALIGELPEQYAALEQIAWYYSGADEVADGAANRVIAAEWDELAEINLEALADTVALRRPDVVDALREEFTTGTFRAKDLHSDEQRDLLRRATGLT